MPILPTDPNTGQSQPAGQALGDLFGNVNRPQLNAFVANSQERTGLVSAQTQDAMVKASQAQEQMEAWDKIKTALIAQGAPESDATLARDAIVGANNHDPVTALKTVAQAKLGYGNPASQTAGQQMYEGKLAGPVTVPGESVMPVAPPGGSPFGAPQQTPLAAAQTAEQTALAGLNTTKDNAGGFAPKTTPIPSSLTDDAAYNAAVKYNQFGVIPPLGMGAAAAADRQKILNFAAQQSHDPNWTPPSFSTGGQQSPAGAALPGAAPPPSTHPTLAQASNAAASPFDMKAQQAMLTDQTKRTANADASEQTALKQMDIVRKVLATADQSGVPYANTIVNSVRNHMFGDPNVSSYQNALSTMRTEYARVISLATGATGITDAAMRNGQDLFPDGLAPAQFEANAAVAAQEMAARTGSMHGQIADAKRTMHTPSGTAPPPGAAGGTAPISLDQYLQGKGY